MFVTSQIATRSLITSRKQREKPASEKENTMSPQMYNLCALLFLAERVAMALSLLDRLKPDSGGYLSR